MSDRRALAGRLAPVLLVVVLAFGVAAGGDFGLELAAADETAARDMTAALDALPADGVVLVGFDPDIGTYAEIRATVRALIARLLGSGATLAVVSLTPEGRALAVAELDRLGRLEADPGQLIDLGFVPGAEAALVGLARELSPPSGGVVSLDLPGSVGAPGLTLVVGGIDIGPRTWVEQFAPRVDAGLLVAVAPTVLLPELLPYRASGQLDALLATPRDGAAFRAAVGPGPLSETGPGTSTLAVLIGLLAAVAVLGQAAGARLRQGLRSTRSREAA